MKKIIAIILSISLILSMGITGFAADTTSSYVTVSVENLTFTPGEGEEYPTGVMLDAKKVKIREDDTIMSIVLRALDSEDISYNKDEETGELIGGYISEVGGLAEMDGGETSGWMMTVNDWFATVGASAMYPSDGDEIVLQYSLNWGADLGSDWMSSDTSLEDLSFEGGVLSPEFSSDVFEYELILDRDVEEVSADYDAVNKNFQVRTYKNAEITDGVINGEAEYESELSGLSAGENDLKEELGYYKNGKDIPVSENDIITIGCGLTGWTSMNVSEGGSIYTITVKNPVPSEYETAVDELYSAYNEFIEAEPTDNEFKENMTPSIIELYDEFKALESTDEVSKKHISKVYEMLGAALLNGFDVEIEKIYSNSKLKLEINSENPVSETAVLRITATPKENDEYVYEDTEEIYSADFDLSQENTALTIKVGELSRKLKVGERIEFYLDFYFEGEVVYSLLMDKASVKEKVDDGGGSSGGTFRPTVTPTPAPETTVPETPVETPPVTDPYVYFSVPEKVIGNEAAFTDLGEFSWAEVSINALVKDGILNGISDTEFAPGANVTREQFVKMIVLAFDIEIPTQVIPNFTDVDSNAWYAPYVYAASYAGVVQGESLDTFGIGKNITRQDMATMLHRAIGSPTTSYEPSFIDYAQISDYAKPAVSLFTDEGTISGYMELDGTYFRPLNFATRAEAAKMIYNAK